MSLAFAAVAVFLAVCLFFLASAGAAIRLLERHLSRPDRWR